MAIKIKSATAIAKKWADVTPARARQWEEEIKATPTEEYSAPAIAAAPIWEQGVMEAAARDGYAKGVAEHAEKWKRKALTVGPARFGPGARLSLPSPSRLVALEEHQETTRGYVKLARPCTPSG